MLAQFSELKCHLISSSDCLHLSSNPLPLYRPLPKEYQGLPLPILQVIVTATALIDIASPHMNPLDPLGKVDPPARTLIQHWCDHQLKAQHILVLHEGPLEGHPKRDDDRPPDALAVGGQCREQIGVVGQVGLDQLIVHLELLVRPDSFVAAHYRAEGGQLQGALQVGLRAGGEQRVGDVAADVAVHVVLAHCLRWQHRVEAGAQAWVGAVVHHLVARPATPRVVGRIRPSCPWKTEELGGVWLIDCLRHDPVPDRAVFVMPGNRLIYREGAISGFHWKPLPKVDHHPHSFRLFQNVYDHVFNELHGLWVEEVE